MNDTDRSLNAYGEYFLRVGDANITIITDNSLAYPSAEREVEEKYVTPHIHPCCQLFHLERGSFVVYASGGVFALNPGDTLIIPPNLLHYTMLNGDDTLRYGIEFYIEGGEEAEEGGCRGILNSALRPDSPPLHIKKSPLAGDIFRKLIYYDNSFTAGRDECVNACFTELMFFLVNSISNGTSASGNSCGNAPSAGEVAFPTSDKQAADTAYYRLYMIDNTINYNYSDDVTLENLAKKLNLSPKHVGRMIKRSFNMNFEELRMNIRMSVAIQLLCKTDMPINEIAEYMGYSTLNGFYLAFKAVTGSTPAAIRASYKDAYKANV